MRERKITFSKRDDDRRYGYVNSETGVYIRRNAISHMGWVVIKPTRHGGQLRDCVALLITARRVATDTVREVRAEIAAAYVEAQWLDVNVVNPFLEATTIHAAPIKPMVNMSHGERTAVMYRAAQRRHSAPSN